MNMRSCITAADVTDVVTVRTDESVSQGRLSNTCNQVVAQVQQNVMGTRLLSPDDVKQLHIHSAVAQ